MKNRRLSGSLERLRIHFHNSLLRFKPTFPSVGKRASKKLVLPHRGRVIIVITALLRVQRKNKIIVRQAVISYDDSFHANDARNRTKTNILWRFTIKPSQETGCNHVCDTWRQVRVRGASPRRLCGDHNHKGQLYDILCRLTDAV